MCVPEELAHVQGKEKHQVTFGQVMMWAWRPRVVRWMLHPMYHTDPAKASAATRRLDGIKGSVVLPGHGPALRMPLSEALAALRR